MLLVRYSIGCIAIILRTHLAYLKNLEDILKIIQENVQ